MQTALYQLSKFGNDIVTGEDKLPSLNQFVHVDKLHTANLKDYIINEYWGESNKHLFHYLDYIFKINLINNNVYQYTFNNGVTIAVFNTRLFKKTDKYKRKPLYFIITKLNDDSFQKKKKWVLPEILADTSIDQNVSQYSKTIDELQFCYNILKQDIPPALVIDDIYESFDFDYTKIILDWKDILPKILNRKRGGCSRKIVKDEIKQQSGKSPNTVTMVKDLIKPFEKATKHVINSKNKNYIIPSIYFDEKCRNYNICYQMLLTINYPSNTKIKFVIVLESYSNRLFGFKKLLSFEMGRKNARLLSILPKQWQYPNIIIQTQQTKSETKDNSNQNRFISKKHNNTNNKQQCKINCIDNLLMGFGNNTLEIKEFPKSCFVKRTTTLILDYRNNMVDERVLEVPILNKLNQTNNCGMLNNNHCEIFSKQSIISLNSVSNYGIDALNYLKLYGQILINTAIEYIHINKHKITIVADTSIQPSFSNLLQTPSFLPSPPMLSISKQTQTIEECINNIQLQLNNGINNIINKSQCSNNNKNNNYVS